MRVLVTGGNGFIGKALCASLLEAGHSVRATYRSAPAQISDVEWVHAEQVDGIDFAPLIEGCDGVIHLAALAHQVGKKISFEEYDRTNHLATANLARAVAASRSVQRLVFVSSIGAVCSASDRVITAETECRPDSDYGRSKRA